MKQRCADIKHASWKWYGKRGISFDPRWEVFENFLDDMGEKPSKQHRLHRLDDDGNYTKENCCWSVNHRETQLSQCSYLKAA